MSAASSADTTRPRGPDSSTHSERRRSGTDRKGKDQTLLTCYGNWKLVYTFIDEWATVIVGITALANSCRFLLTWIAPVSIVQMVAAFAAGMLAGAAVLVLGLVLVFMALSVPVGGGAASGQLPDGKQPAYQAAAPGADGGKAGLGSFRLLPQLRLPGRRSAAAVQMPGRQVRDLNIGRHGKFRGQVWTMPASAWPEDRVLEVFPPRPKGDLPGMRTWMASLRGGLLVLEGSRAASASTPPHAAPRPSAAPAMQVGHISDIVEISLSGCRVELLTDGIPPGKSPWWKKVPIRLSHRERTLLEGEDALVLFAADGASKEQWHTFLTWAACDDGAAADVRAQYAKYSAALRRMGIVPFPTLLDAAADGAAAEPDRAAAAPGSTAGSSPPPRRWFRFRRDKHRGGGGGGDGDGDAGGAEAGAEGGKVPRRGGERGGHRWRTGGKAQLASSGSAAELQRAAGATPLPTPAPRGSSFPGGPTADPLAAKVAISPEELEGLWFQKKPWRAPSVSSTSPSAAAPPVAGETREASGADSLEGIGTGGDGSPTEASGGGGGEDALAAVADAGGAAAVRSRARISLTASEPDMVRLGAMTQEPPLFNHSPLQADLQAEEDTASSVGVLAEDALPADESASANGTADAALQDDAAAADAPSVAAAANPGPPPSPPSVPLQAPPSGGENKPPEPALAHSSGLDGVNMLLARVAFDLLRNPQFKEELSKRIQRRLDEVPRPKFVKRLRLQSLELSSSCVPALTSTAAQPSPTSSSILPQLLLNIVLPGDAHLTIETQVDVREAGAWDRLHRAIDTLRGVEPSSYEDDDDDSILAKGMADSLDGAEDALESTPLSGSPGALTDAIVEDYAVDASARSRSPLASRPSSSSSRYVRFIGGVRRAVAGTAQAVAEKWAEELAKVPIRLRVTVRRLEGVVLLWIAPPPSRSLWYSFLDVPRVDLDIKPQVGNRLLQYSAMAARVTSWLRHKIMKGLSNSLVFPSCADFLLPGLLPMDAEATPLNIAAQWHKDAEPPPPLSEGSDSATEAPDDGPDDCMTPQLFVQHSLAHSLDHHQHLTPAARSPSQTPAGLDDGGAAMSRRAASAQLQPRARRSTGLRKSLGNLLRGRKKGALAAEQGLDTSPGAQLGSSGAALEQDGADSTASVDSESPESVGSGPGPGPVPRSPTPPSPLGPSHDQPQPLAHAAAPCPPADPAIVPAPSSPPLTTTTPLPGRAAAGGNDVPATSSSADGPAEGLAALDARLAADEVTTEDLLPAASLTSVQLVDKMLATITDAEDEQQVVPVAVSANDGRERGFSPPRTTPPVPAAAPDSSGLTPLAADLQLPGSSSPMPAAAPPPPPAASAPPRGREHRPNRAARAAAFAKMVARHHGQHLRDVLHARPFARDS